MRMAYHCRCEAGIKGGNSELDRERRRAELDMDSIANLRLNRRHFLQAYSSYQACTQNGIGPRVRLVHRWPQVSSQGPGGEWDPKFSVKRKSGTG